LSTRTTTDSRPIAPGRRPARRLLEAVSTVAPGLRPATQRMLIRTGYAVVNRWLDGAEEVCMNYGYADLDTDATGGPPPSSEPYGHRLYEHVTGGVDLYGADALEVGCGRGGGAAFVARRGHVARLVGVDFSEPAIAYAREHHVDPRLSFVRADAERLPFEDAAFDVVLNVESSHCYPRPDRFFGEAFRVLRRGGHLLLADLRLERDIAATRRSLRAAGFRIDVEERITAQVARALELDTPRRARFVRERVPRPLQSYVLNFAGTKGTEVYEALRHGELEYVRFALAKPDA